MQNRRSVLKGTATLVLSGMAASKFAGPSSARAGAPFGGVMNPGFYRMRLGGMEVTALSDGSLLIPLAQSYTNTTEEHARQALAAAFQDGSSETSVNVFLVNTGTRLILVDAGTGTYLGPEVGRLIANMADAGYKPEQVDDIVLTHVHTDHSGGLILDGQRAFPNATVHVSRLEAEFWLETAEADRPSNVPVNHFTEARDCLSPYVEAERFLTFDDGAEVLPGITSILRAGHTPGHSSFLLASEGQSLLFWGDITHGDVLQFDEPGVAFEFDVDQQMAVASRETALREAADQSYLVAGSHIAFPGLGHVRRDSINYDWVPLNYRAG